MKLQGNNFIGDYYFPVISLMILRDAIASQTVDNLFMPNESKNTAHLASNLDLNKHPLYIVGIILTTFSYLLNKCLTASKNPIPFSFIT